MLDCWVIFSIFEYIFSSLSFFRTIKKALDHCIIIACFMLTPMGIHILWHDDVWKIVHTRHKLWRSSLK